MKIKREVLIGILSIVAIACFIYGFNFLKGINFFAGKNKYYAVYKDVDGLVEANPLVLNGYKVGIVSHVTITDDAYKNIIVTMLVDDKISIPKNSTARIVSSDIMGSKAIQIVLGNSSVSAVSGDTLMPEKEASLKQSVNKAIEPLQKKAESLISSIDSVMTVVHEILDKDARNNLSGSFENINLAFSSLQKTAYRLDTLVATEKYKLSSIFTKVNTIATTLSDNSAQLSNIIQNFSNISDSLAKANIASTINNANATLIQTTAIMTKINKGQGTMGMLVNNDSLYRKLDKSAGDLDQLLIDLKAHPKRYVHFSVFDSKKEKK